MKRIIIMGIVLSLVGAGCGGGGGIGTPSGDTSDVVKITSVTGDGSAPDIFQNFLIVTGEGFSEGMIVELAGDAGNYELTYTLDSETQLTANLPMDLQEGQYEVTLTADGKNATAGVTILKGEKGDTGATGPVGPQGPKGDMGATGEQGSQGVPGSSGLLVSKEYLCGASGDIESDPNILRKGLSGFVIKYSDGSYLFSCNAYYSTSFDSDSQNNLLWFASNSVGVINGILLCPTLDVTAGYSIQNNTIAYVNALDSNQTSGAISCTQAYP